MMYYKKNNELIDLKDYLPVEKVQVGGKNPFVNEGSYSANTDYFMNHSTEVKVIDDFTTQTSKSIGLIIPAGHFIRIDNWVSGNRTPNPPTANHSFLFLNPINKADYSCPMRLGFGDSNSETGDEVGVKVQFYGLIPSKAACFNDEGNSIMGSVDLSIAEAAIYRNYTYNDDALVYNAWLNFNPVYVASGDNYYYNESLTRFKITLYKWNEE